MSMDSVFKKHMEIWDKLFEVAKIIDLIRERDPNAVRFNAADENNIRSIYFYIQSGNFETLMLMFGHPFLIQLLRYYEHEQEFETCAKIVERIKRYNELAKDNLSYK